MQFLGTGLVTIWSLTSIGSPSSDIPSSVRSREVTSRVAPRLREELKKSKLSLGSPVFLRIFKQERILEVWVKRHARFHLFRAYEICKYSGTLGPKLKQGDRQAPEGFYRVKPQQLNPSSRFHLSFDLGYPNTFDRHHRRTGGLLMVHGDCFSIGCYAMTTLWIEDIYTLVDAALRKGQTAVEVHAFPFMPTGPEMRAHRDSKWLPFWQNLKEGYDYFERTRVPPMVTVEEGRYVINNP